jgi:hypothetical protein
MADEEDDAAEETYNMSLFLITKEFPDRLPPLKDIYPWIQQHAEPLEGHIMFPAGTTTKFFEVLKWATNQDLMTMVGGVVYENTPEEELAAGLLTPEKARAALDDMRSTITDSVKKPELEKRVKAKGLDLKWFLQQMLQLMTLLTAALAKGGVILGLYE